MHMADALLSPTVALAMNAVSVAAIGVSVAKVKKEEFSDKIVPLMGVAGALVFAGQMINFTIPATGSSGHIGGGILLAGLLGGVPAFLSIVSVLIIQCLFFADGGLLALGCNIFNLGVIPCLIVYPLIFKPLLNRGTDYQRLSLASITAVVIGLEAGAFFVVLQTLLSGITELPFSTFVALMLPIHLAIGLVEGVVTAAILSFVYKMRPEIIELSLTGNGFSGFSTRKVIVIFIMLAIMTGGFFSQFASTHPDGLEWAVSKTTEKALSEPTELEAEGLLFDSAASIQEFTALLPGYAFAAEPEKASGTTAAGLVGAAITFGLALGLGLVISKYKKHKKADALV